MEPSEHRFNYADPDARLATKVGTTVLAGGKHPPSPRSPFSPKRIQANGNAMPELTTATTKKLT